MYRNSTDKRVIQSAGALYNAVIELMTEKSFDKIGIKEVCEKAKIGRATFYRNFDYVDDVFRFEMNRLFEQLDETKCGDMGDVKTSEDLLEFFTFWSSHGEFLKVLYDAGRWSIFGEQFLIVSQIKMKEKFEEFNLNDVQYQYFHNSIQVSISTTLRTWLERNQKETAEELVNMFELPFEMFLKMHK